MVSKGTGTSIQIGDIGANPSGTVSLILINLDPSIEK